MVTETVIPALKLLKSGDRIALFVADRITVRCQYHADCRIILKLQVDRIQSAVYTCLHHFDDIIFHTRENHLCLGISETCIVLQYLWSVCGQHQSKEDDTLKFSSLCCHCINSCLINMFFTKLVNFFCIEGAGREGSHSAGVQSLIAVLCTLVILCGGHDFDGFSVNIRKNRHLASGHKLFHYHAVSGGSELLVLHDLLHAVLCLLQRVADQHTLAERQSVCL